MRVTRRLAVATGVLAAGIALGLPTAAYADGTSSGNAGIGNGTQVQAPVQAPVNVCGNGVGVLGAGAGVSGDCQGDASDTPTCPSSGPTTYHSDSSEATTARKPEASSSACPQTAVPTPSADSTPSASPSTVQAAATRPATPTLPVTGAKLTIIVTTALVLLAAGVSAVFLARRRRA